MNETLKFLKQYKFVTTEQMIDLQNMVRDVPGKNIYVIIVYSVVQISDMFGTIRAFSIIISQFVY